MTVDMVPPFLPVLACIIVIGSHGWLLTRRKRGEMHGLAEFCIIFAYSCFLTYYGLHLREAWLGVSA